MAEDIFYIQKESSREVLTKIRQIIEDFSGIVKVTITLKPYKIYTDSRENIIHSIYDIINFLTDHPGAELSSVVFSFRHNNGGYLPTITYSRTEEIYSSLHFVHGNYLRDSSDFTKAVQFFSQYFTFTEKHTLLKEAMPDMFKEQVLNYQNSVNDVSASLNRLEELTANQMKTNSEYFQKLTRDNDLLYERRFSKLEEDFNKRKQELLEEIDQEKNLLNSREQELDKRKEKYDLRENKAVRRDLLDKISNLIAENKAINLSDSTIKKRKPVFAICLVSMLIGLAMAGLSIYTIFTQKDMDKNLVMIPFTSGIVLFSTTLIYLLRWSNSWVKKHTDVEFQNIQFSQDILRASWLAEMVFEAQKENDKEVPPILIEQFSKNLFNRQKSEEQHHPLDDVFKMTKSFKKIKIGKGLLEAEQTEKQS